MHAEDIPTKWQVIADRCGDLGFKKSAALAKEIDGILLKLYGLRHTPKWVKDYDPELHKTPPQIHTLANQPKYCIACHVDGPNCLDCRFREKMGRSCNTPGSLFSRFYSSLIRETENQETTLCSFL